MTPSDFLTILGLAIAAWAIIAANERRFIALFFSKQELALGLILVAVIHYLLAFEWIRQHWFPGLSIFTVKRGVPAATWAYVCALALLAYPIGRVSFGFFAKVRLKQLIGLYESLLERGDIDLLIRYLLKYHIADIQLYLEGVSDEEVVVRGEDSRTNVGQVAKRSKSFSWAKRETFAEAAYSWIVTKEEFVRRAANINPGLFAQVIKGMQCKRAANQDFVKLYLACLFEHKNAQFIKELKTVDGARDSILDRIEYVDLPILEAVLVNTEVAAENYVWYSIGQEARKGMQYDNDQLTFLKQNYDEQLEPELWQQKIFIAVVFFNYMVRETIYRESGWHMWLFYYQRFVELLIRNNIPDAVRPGRKRAKTFNEHLIETIVRNTLEWIELAVDENTEGQSIDVVKCLGEILVDVMDTDETALSNEFKVEVFNSVLSTYFDLSKHQNTETESWTRIQMEGMLRNPSNPEWDEVECSRNYLTMFESAWRKFDKVPFQGIEDNGSVEQFKRNVLDRMGIGE
jgi:hypothetical protein